ncbi:MAG: hypothetical protein CMJ78_13875 [Planctomycetaceae bacterium]|nr:hypothetical protein [Planctomycetaceae bacterium]
MNDLRTASASVAKLVKSFGQSCAPKVLTTFATVVFLATTANAQQPLDKASLEFIKTHCVRCHNGETQEGKFRLDNLSTDFSNPQVAQKWGEVVFRINAGEMPPPKEKQPTAKQLGHFAEAITTKIRSGAAARMARRGRVEHYRLSRQEYAHTVYDLLGVVFDVEAPGAFNEDPLWHGFDRIGSMLSTAPSHVDRYFNAADTVVELASLNKEQPSKTVRKSADEGKRYLLQMGEGWNAVSVRSPGYYRIKIQVSGLPAFTGRMPRLSLWHNQQKKSFAGKDLASSENKPDTVVFEGRFPAGGYAIRNHARSQKHPNGAYKLFRNEQIDASIPLASYKGGFKAMLTKVVDVEGRPVMPTLLVDWVEIEGPLTTDDHRAKRNGLFPADAKDRKEVHACLKRFAERAWRRPVSDGEIDPFVKFIAAEQEAGENFAAAYKSALASMLVSRSFFNLEEGSPDEDRVKLNDFELASRLSYFLWSSMPDDKLFVAARSGKLHTAEGLTSELDRMLADPKINRFLDSFPKQWLQLHRVGMFQPDPNLYPEYDPWLEESMVMETTAYFAEMFNNNLPLREAVDSNWTMLNSRLAIHYGIDVLEFARIPSAEANNSTNKKGVLANSTTPSGLRRVTLRPEDQRGGILTHASVLSLTSDGTRHRPVHRGAWLSEAILARTPPPPPPNVEPLEPVASDQPKTTIRAQLESHRTNSTCASCHAKIDALGLAFDNFDAIGRWRDTERVEGGTGDNPPVDASGSFADGKTFGGPAEFKKLLAENDDRLAQAFLEQLAMYALRRVMTVDDVQQLHAIAASTKPDNHRLQNLIRGLVLSDLFQRR